MTRQELKIQVFMEMAKQVSRLSTCSRLSVGALLFSEDFRLLGEGYNGRMGSHCVDTNPEGLKEMCLCSHAEIGALLHRNTTLGKPHTIFVTAFPCPECLKALSSAGVKRVYYNDPYRYFEESRKIADFFGIEYHEVKLGNGELVLRGAEGGNSVLSEDAGAEYRLAPSRGISQPGVGYWEAPDREGGG